MSQTTFDIKYKDPAISPAAYLPPLNYPLAYEQGVTQDRINQLQKQGITVQIVQTHTPAPPTTPQQQPTVPAPPSTPTVLEQVQQQNTQQPAQTSTTSKSMAARTVGPLGLPASVVHVLWVLRERYIRKEVHKKLHPLI